jgi:hypothetical protein
MVRPLLELARKNIRRPSDLTSVCLPLLSSPLPTPVSGRLAPPERRLDTAERWTSGPKPLRQEPCN